MPVACNSPLRFGATALGQQEDMWLALLRPNFPPQTSHIPETLSAGLKRMMKDIKANHEGGRYGRNE